MDTLVKPRAGSRRKVHQDQTEKPADATPKRNVPDLATVLAYGAKILKQKERVTVERRALDKIRKLAKNSGVVMKVLDAVVAYADEDPDKVLQFFQDVQLYSGYFNLPIGSQLNLLDIPTATILKFDELAKKAERAGYVHGAMGKDRDMQAYPVGHDHHQAYLTGYTRAQLEIAERFKPIDMALSSEDKSDDGDDDEDHDTDGDSEGEE